MILKNNKEVGFIYKNNQNIDKVLNNGNLIFEQGFTRETSGVPPITLPTLSTGKNLRNYKIYGNSVQNGTPTPSNPVEIESVGDRTKNLFDAKLFNERKVDGKRKDNNGNIVNDNISNYSDYYISVKPNTKYTLYLIGQQGIYEYDENKNLIRRTIYAVNSRTYTTSSTTKYIQIQYIKNSINVTNAQLEEGPDATDYEPYGYKIPISVSSAANKNLFWLKDATNVSALNQIYNCSNQTFTKEITNLVGMTYIISNAAFSQICYCEPLQSGKTYIWKFHNAKLLSTGHYLVLTYEDETTENWYENTPITLTKNATITAIRQAYRDYTKDETESFQIQVEEGSVATDYEPYYPPVNIYLDEPLRKIGDYADYIDFTNKKVVRNIGKYIVTGSESIVKFSSTMNYYLNNVLPNAKYAINIQIFSNYYIGRISGGGSSYSEGNAWLQSTSSYPRCYFGTNYSTIDDFITFLQNLYNLGTPVEVVYPLNTPTEEDIELPTIPSIKGTTIYSVGTNIQPSNMYIKYKGR